MRYGFKPVIPHEWAGTAFVYCFLLRNKERIADSGSDTVFPEVSASIMRGTELVLPDKAACEAFATWAQPILDMQERLKAENRNLAQLRDTLLPKLMSGEIDVSRIDTMQLNSHLPTCIISVHRPADKQALF